MERVNVLGVGVSVLNQAKAWEAIRWAIHDQRKGYITATGVHGVIDAQDDASLKQIFNASFLTTPDGMPMVWFGKLAGHREMDRVYGPDLMLAICDRGREYGFRHFFYGGKPGVADQLKERLTARLPGLEVVGTYSPPFRSLNAGEEAALAATMAEVRPDITWIGLSTPKQDRFMAAFLDRLPTTLMIGVGAAFDFHSGQVRQAPGWIQRAGLEWFFRLCCEPRRLWRRYLSIVPRFIVLATLQQLGWRSFPSPWDSR